MNLVRGLPRVNLIVALTLLPALAFGFDYPTQDRVEYVMECMQEKPDKPSFEMVSKCSCALDEIRKKLPHKQFIEMSTAMKAITIAGDRSLRESEPAQKAAREFRELQAKARKACYIN
jgi:lysyl-tRNA synthetase class II